MKLHDFLAHHGIRTNPFAEEDAQTDQVFKAHCLEGTHHAAWDKIYGDPNEPATAIVFGEKGAGKTALRLQVTRKLKEHNDSHPAGRVFVVEYDDFNPFLDRFRTRLGRRGHSVERTLSQWRLWDHIDAILALAVTDLIDRALLPHSDAAFIDLKTLDRHQSRDVLLLAAAYDQSTSAPLLERWKLLRRRTQYHSWRAVKPLVIGVLVTAVLVALVAWKHDWFWPVSRWPYAGLAAALLGGWTPWLLHSLRRLKIARRMGRQMRVLNHKTGTLWQTLNRIAGADLDGQPLPTSQRSDDRYELLAKLQGVLRTLGFSGMVVLVDRVDEPYLVNGSSEHMRALIWPLLDNKLLKHPGLGLKLLLPIELAYYLDREDRDFYQRARLDKQNMIPSLVWSGEALFDVANTRIRACADTSREKPPALRDLIDRGVSDQRLIEALRVLRVPRHLFKFLYRLLVAHCDAHTDEAPSWTISASLFESTLAVFQKDLDAFDRGVGPG
ncbi:MAG: hypothetical protein KDA63_14240 [Planctomycetales bacterium]|nr:hypothetical protein [Planctomycetales bacterium]